MPGRETPGRVVQGYGMQASQNPHGVTSKPQRAADLRRLSRTEVKPLTEVFIGHCNLVYHRHKIGLAESPLCRLCGEDNETSTHISVAVIQTKSVAQVLALWHGLWGRA